MKSYPIDKPLAALGLLPRSSGLRPRDPSAIRKGLFRIRQLVRPDSHSMSYDKEQAIRSADAQ